MARAALAEQRLAGSSQWHAGGHAALSAMLGVNRRNGWPTQAGACCYNDVVAVAAVNRVMRCN
jgi:hypothetical protein